jgi:5'-nucleotidase
MENRRTILVDMDGILANFNKKIIEMYNASTGENKLVSDITRYDFSTFSRTDLIHSFYRSKGFFKSLEPMPGAEAYLEEILKLGHHVEIVTQLPIASKWASTEKTEWLKYYFPYFNLNNITFTRNKYLMRGDILFDDNPKHLETWAALNRLESTFTIQYEYNKHCNVDYMLQYDSAWQQFYMAISEYFT